MTNRTAIALRRTLGWRPCLRRPECACPRCLRALCQCAACKEGRK